MRVQLRAPGTGGGDHGHRYLLNELRTWVFDNTADLFAHSVVFVEHQPPEAHTEIKSIQLGLQALLGLRCKPVNAMAYKTRFAEYFPRHPLYDTFAAHRQKENQKTYDRGSAVTSGRALIDADVVSAYEDAVGDASKIDDAYEAYFIALYGAIALVDETVGGGILHRPRPPPRRTVADGPHKRGRVAITKAEAKRAERAKAKAKAATAKVAVPRRPPAAAAVAAAPVVSLAGTDDLSTDDSDTEEEGRTPTKKRRIDTT
jgi:hypothetical protein